MRRQTNDPTRRRQPPGSRAWVVAWGLLVLAASGGVKAHKDLLPAPLSSCDGTSSTTVFAPAQLIPALPARAVWLDARRLRWPGADPAGRYVLAVDPISSLARPGERLSARRTWPLHVDTSPVPAAIERRFAWVGAGPVLALEAGDGTETGAEVALVRIDDQDRVLAATGVQIAGALDDAYAAAIDSPPLGASTGGDGTTFRLWAPTASAVAVCLHDDDAAAARTIVHLQRDAATGIWSTTRTDAPAGTYYTYVVDVFAPGVGRVRNRVTDPYSASLGADSHRSVVIDFADPALAPPGWADDRAPRAIESNPDLTVYELHVRDFSTSDASVPAAHRGKYLAFAEPDSIGMRHLRSLAAAGVTDVHLLPVFDLATVPETGCVTPSIAAVGAGDREAPATATAQAAQRDCFNWGYDPLHFNAPEGSYASDAHVGATRIRELRTMVAALHRAGLRVGMDVVYNHMSAAGQDPRSVLDRIVPGYYHRLDADGAVTHSTCCANTATENAMMQRLMLDSTGHWVRQYHVDSFRFDLMGHQPRAAMEALQARVDRAAGHRIPLLGEGWNFGEVADGQRFVQASQLSLAGSGIGTFSDRARDAVRGGGPADSGEAMFTANAWAAGFGPGMDPNAAANAADLVRVGLAGSLRDYRLADGRTLAQVDYKGQPAGYTAQPGEVVNYVENHDNQTLFDLLALKLPPDTAPHERARVQLLAAATTALSQGIAYFHAGLEVLRSKSL
ncbi:MAG: DUF3372 domain-containing protein, partial [Arenimonas sp.]